PGYSIESSMRSERPSSRSKTIVTAPPSTTQLTDRSNTHSSPSISSTQPATYAMSTTSNNQPSDSRPTLPSAEEPESTKQQFVLPVSTSTMVSALSTHSEDPASIVQLPNSTVSKSSTVIATPTHPEDLEAPVSSSQAPTINLSLLDDSDWLSDALSSLNQCTTPLDASQTPSTQVSSVYSTSVSTASTDATNTAVRIPSATLRAVEDVTSPTEPPIRLDSTRVVGTSPEAPESLLEQLPSTGEQVLACNVAVRVTSDASYRPYTQPSDTSQVRSLVSAATQYIHPSEPTSDVVRSSPASERPVTSSKPPGTVADEPRTHIHRLPTPEASDILVPTVSTDRNTTCVETPIKLQDKLQQSQDNRYISSLSTSSRPQRQDNAVKNPIIEHIPMPLAKSLAGPASTLSPEPVARERLGNLSHNTFKRRHLLPPSVVITSGAMKNNILGIDSLKRSIVSNATDMSSTSPDTSNWLAEVNNRPVQPADDRVDAIIAHTPTVTAPPAAVIQSQLVDELLALSLNHLDVVKDYSTQHASMPASDPSPQKSSRHFERSSSMIQLSLLTSQESAATNMVDSIVHNAKSSMPTVASKAHSQDTSPTRERVPEANKSLEDVERSDPLQTRCASPYPAHTVSVCTPLASTSPANSSETLSAPNSAGLDIPLEDVTQYALKASASCTDYVLLLLVITEDALTTVPTPSEPQDNLRRSRSPKASKLSFSTTSNSSMLPDRLCGEPAAESLVKLFAQLVPKAPESARALEEYFNSEDQECLRLMSLPASPTAMEQLPSHVCALLSCANALTMILSVATQSKQTLTTMSTYDTLSNASKRSISFQPSNANTRLLPIDSPQTLGAITKLNKGRISHSLDDWTPVFDLLHICVAPSPLDTLAPTANAAMRTTTRSIKLVIKRTDTYTVSALALRVIVQPEDSTLLEPDDPQRLTDNLASTTRTVTRNTYTPVAESAVTKLATDIHFVSSYPTSTISSSLSHIDASLRNNVSEEPTPKSFNVLVAQSIKAHNISLYALVRIIELVTLIDIGQLSTSTSMQVEVLDLPHTLALPGPTDLI
ncbi:hypothetical protein V565_245330, partial [Rhizoctonia solani 123E]